MHGKRRREMIHLHRALVCTFFGGAQQAVAAQPKEGRLPWHCDRHDRARAKMRITKVRSGPLAATPIKATSQALSPESISRRRALAMVDDS